MPKYIANRDTLLAHECRVVRAGELFETTFPPAKNAKGEEVEMVLGDNIALAPKDKPKAKGDDLAG